MTPLTDRTLGSPPGQSAARLRYAWGRRTSRLLNVVCGVDALESARFLRSGYVEGKASPMPPRTLVPDAEYLVLHPARSTPIAPAPRPWDDTYPYPVADGVPLTTPPYGCWVLPGAKWYPRDGVVFAGERSSMVAGAFRFPLRFTRVLDLNWRRAPVLRVPGVGMGLETDFDDNHYHNLLDLAPRVAALRHPDFQRYPEISLFTASLGRNPALDHLVRRLLPPNVRVVHVDPHTTVQPDVLLMPDPPMDAWYCVPPAWYLEAVRETAAAHATDGPRQAIYISRGGAKKRRIVNEAELIGALEARGVQCVRTETLAPSDLIELMGRSDLVVSMMGAGLANTIYSPPGTTVVEISSRHHWTPELWFIAQAAGLEFHSSLADDRECATSPWRGAKYNQLRHGYYRRRDADLLADVADVCSLVDVALSRRATASVERPAPELEETPRG